MYLEIQIIAVFDIALLKMYQEINVLKIISYSTKKIDLKSVRIFT